MRTKNFFQNSVKVSAIFLFAVAMVSVFSACEKDDDDDKDDPVPAPEETRSLESYHYDDLAVMLSTLAETDAEGRVANRYFGEALDAKDPDHLFIGVDRMEEAKDMFRLWLAPDVEVTEHDDGSLSATLTNILGHEQGTVRLTPGTEENHVAEVTTDAVQHVFSRITFLKNEAWPGKGLLQASAHRYYKFDIVRNVRLKDISEWLKDDDQKLNFVCIQGSGNGVKPVFCAVTNSRYVSPGYKHYSYMIRESRYTPGTGTYPTAANIQQLLLKDWSAFVETFKEAGCGPMIGGTEYWYDECHFTFILRYHGVMDYHSGNTYGENGNKEYYFLLRMYGLDDSCIKDGMSF